MDLIHILTKPYSNSSQYSVDVDVLNWFLSLLIQLKNSLILLILL